MGMSSSQARLLTLTARLHSIEHRAQKLEADKLRLANDSDRVYDTYLAALDQTKFVASVLSQDGSMTYVDLTARNIYSYRTLYEQYSLITKDNKALIPKSYSDVYNNTASLSDFLNAFGVNSSYAQTVHHEDPNPTYVNGEQNYKNAHDAWERNCQNIDDSFAADHSQWEQERDKYNSDYADYQRKLKEWQDNLHPDWQAKEPDPDDQSQPWWKTTKDDSLAEKFETAGGSCLSSAKGGYAGCYAHVLVRLIDFCLAYDDSSSYNVNNSWYSSSANNYTTSTGKNVSLSYSDITGAGIANSDSGDATFNEVSQKMNEGLKAGAQSGESSNVTASSGEWEKLSSKWNPDGSLKTLKQWAIDLYYLCKNYSSLTKADGTAVSNTDLSGTIGVFQEAMKSSLTEFNQEVYDSYHQTWEEEEPDPPTFNGTLRDEPVKPPYPPEPQLDDYIGGIAPTLPRDEVVNHTTFKDKDYAQWLINIWYKMEGKDEVAKVMTTVVHDDATNVDVALYSVDNISKSPNKPFTPNDMGAMDNGTYIIIPDDKLDDPTWIRNAVLEGYVIIQSFDKEQVKFRDTSVSVTTRIQEIQDEVGLKKAEAKYEADMKAIDKKDRYYDTQIAKLENERSAIKEEIDSLKTVIDDNVDRTFKLFS